MSSTFQQLKLSHSGALQLLLAAVERATAMRKPQCIAVVDDSCNLLAFLRMDGAKILSEGSAIRKAGQVIGGIGVGSGTGDEDREVGNAALAGFASAQTFEFD